MKIKPGVFTGLAAILVLFASVAYAQQSTGPQDSMTDQQQSDLHAALSQDPQTVMQVQEALSDRGYDPGAADGKWKTDTEGALMQFQQAQGMEASGQLDQETLASLGISGAGAAAGGGQQDMSSQPSAPPDQSGAGGQQGGRY